MAPAAIRMVLVEGDDGDGLIVEEDDFDVAATLEAEATTEEPTAATTATSSAPAQVLSAILGTREGATDAGCKLSAVGVTWTDQEDAAALRDVLAAHKIENVMLVSAFLAAAALGQAVGGAVGYQRTAVLFVEPDTATLAVVNSADGSVCEVHRQSLSSDDDTALAELTELVSGAESLEAHPDGLYLVGAGVDLALLKPQLEAATSLAVSAPEEPDMALARGAALASSSAPLFSSSTAALAYAQDTDTGALELDSRAVADYLRVPEGTYAAAAVEGFAYSAVPDADAEAETTVLDVSDALAENERRRRPILLISSGLAVTVISAVVALEIALAIGIRPTVALMPTPGQNLIVPTQQAPATAAPVQAAPAHPNVPAMAAPKPVTLPAPAAALPAPAAPALPAPAAPAVPAPVVVPPAVVPVVPRIQAPTIPDPVLRAPVPQLPVRVTPPQLVPQPRIQIPTEQVPGATIPQSPPMHEPTEQAPFPRSGGPGGRGGEPGPVPGAGPGGRGGEPGGSVPHEGGGGPFGGGGGGPFGGGPFGGGGHSEGPIEGGGSVPHEGGGPFGGGPFGGGGGGPFGGGGHGGGGPFGGGGGFGGGGHGGGGFGGGGGLGGGGHGGGGGGGHR